MPAVIGDLSAQKTGRRKLVSEGLAEGDGFELSIWCACKSLGHRAPGLACWIAVGAPSRYWRCGADERPAWGDFCRHALKRPTDLQ
jgi:hypothetical protein